MKDFLIIAIYFSFFIIGALVSHKNKNKHLSALIPGIAMFVFLSIASLPKDSNEFFLSISLSVIAALIGRFGYFIHLKFIKKTN